MASRYALEIRAATAMEAPGLATLLAEAGHAIDAGAIAERLASLQAARTAGCGELELLAGPDQAALHAFCHATGFEPAGARFIRPLRKRA